MCVILKLQPSTYLKLNLDVYKKEKNSQRTIFMLLGSAVACLHMAGSSQPQHYLAAGCVFGVFGSLVMGPSRIWIFMKINIFLFEHLSCQDFLDPYFSDTCMWVQDPSK